MISPVIRFPPIHRVKYLFSSHLPVLVLALALMFARTILCAHFLGLSEFAKFSLGILVSSSFTIFGCFGFYLLLQRELPILLVNKRFRSGSVLLNLTLLIATFSFLVAIPFCFLGLLKTSPPFFLIALFNGLAQQYFLIVTLYSRSSGNYLRYASDNLIRAILCILVILCAGFYFPSAVFILFLDSVVTALMSLWIYSSISTSTSFLDFSYLSLSVKLLTGISWAPPISLLFATLASFLVLNGDRWISAQALTSKDFSIYSFAALLLAVSQSLQYVVNVSVFPGLARTYALLGAKAAATKALSYTFFALLASLFVSALAYYPICQGISKFYPKFSLATNVVLPFLVIASFRFSDFLSSFLIVIRQERRLLLINLITIFSSVVPWYMYVIQSDQRLAPFSMSILPLSMSFVYFIACLSSVLLVKESTTA